MNLMQEIANIVGNYEEAQGRPRPNLPVRDRIAEVDIAEQNRKAGYHAALADVYEALNTTAARALGVKP